MVDLVVITSRGPTEQAPRQGIRSRHAAVAAVSNEKGRL
jgi:hypothetical protein